MIKLRSAGGDDRRRVHGGLWVAGTQRYAARARDRQNGHLAAQRRSLVQDPTSAARPAQASHRHPLGYDSTSPTYAVLLLTFTLSILGCLSTSRVRFLTSLHPL